MVCFQDFDAPHSPLMRTISLVDSSSCSDTGSKSESRKSSLSSEFLFSIRIHNRHLRCIVEQQIQYLPVSHVWHQRVALAHDSKLSNDDAACLIYRHPVYILLSAVEKFGDLIEVWHDYISVPQWKRDMQERILLQIPDILSYPEVILIHLNGFRPKSSLVAFENWCYVGGTRNLYA
jgi:hypothetical protein